MDYLISILITALTFFLGAQLLSGVTIKNFIYAILVAVVVGVLNLTLGIALKFITLGILSFGIFTLLLDAIIILVADWFLKDFEVKNFWWALGLAAVVAVVDGVLGYIF